MNFLAYYNLSKIGGCFDEHTVVDWPDKLVQVDQLCD